MNPWLASREAGLLAATLLAVSCASDVTPSPDASPGDASSGSEGSPGSDASLEADVATDTGSDASLEADVATDDADAAHASDAPAALDSSTPGDASALGVSCSGATPSWTTQVTPLFRANCSGSELGCHGSTAAGPWPYATLVNVRATKNTCGAWLLVSPGILGQSYLMNKLTGIGMCPGTAQMPLGRTPLANTDLQTVADWICSGAPNN